MCAIESYHALRSARLREFLGEGMANIILIHGGCHGGWCWERVVPLLAARGHTVLAPDLPGAAAEGPPFRDVTLADRTRFVAGLIAAQAEPVILVGHSMGGAVVSCAAETIPDRIAAVVFLAAFLLKDGENMWQAAGRIPRAPPELIISADGKTNRIGAASLEGMFYNTTPREWRDRALQKITDESLAVAASPVHLTQERFGRVARYYIETLRDKAVEPALQRLMQRDWPCRKVLPLDCDHSAFYSMPAELAGHLDGIAADIAH
jgi:pimeloyl-ACP methyl ester carboxylesterase